MAIHDDPRGKLHGSSEFFEVERGVRQGCVLGPTLFIILEYCLHMADLEDIGIELESILQTMITCPVDLSGVSFRLSRGEFLDNCFLMATCQYKLIKAIERLQKVCASIGLDISATKTE
jgi:hypothetical protein